MESCNRVERELDKILEKLNEMGKCSENATSGLTKIIKSAKKLMKSVNNNELTEGQVSILQNIVSLTKMHTSNLADKHRKQHSIISKVGKAIDKNFHSDVGVGLLAGDSIFTGDTSNVLNGLVGQYLYTQGLPNIAEDVLSKSTFSMDKSHKEAYIEIRNIVSALKLFDLNPLIPWMAKYKNALASQNSKLEFKFHRLIFLNLIKNGSKSDAINYGQNYLSQFAVEYKSEIQLMMGALISVSGDIAASRYSHLFDDTLWKDIEETFIREAHAVSGVSVNSPLATCFDAGCTALPVLLKFKKLEKNLFSGYSELPIAIDVGDELRFHSVFMCPILKQQTSELNPPMRLLCGHVISRDAVHCLAQGNTLKCPYCRVEQNIKDTKQIVF